MQRGIGGTAQRGAHHSQGDGGDDDAPRENPPGHQITCVTASHLTPTVDRCTLPPMVTAYSVPIRRGGHFLRAGAERTLLLQLVPSSAVTRTVPSSPMPYNWPAPVQTSRGLGRVVR